MTPGIQPGPFLQLQNVLRCIDIEAFKIEIAGLVTQVQPLYESTKAYCGNYLTDRSAELQIAVLEDDLIYEQRMLDMEAKEEGMKLRKFTGPFLERAAIQRKIAERLLQEDTLLLHGSTVSVDGNAYLFTAACGTGKSTHTGLWREVFGNRAVMINDDKPFLKISQEGVTACGSPWSGKHGLDTNISVPLKGICILYRGAENVIKRITSKDAANMLHHQCYAAETETGREKTVLLLEKLMESVPLWKMHCTKTADAAITAFQAMSANISD